jgi:hypothetical protein
MVVGSVMLLSNSPTIVLGTWKSASSSGVVVTVMMSPVDRAAIPTKSMSPGTSSSSPPSVVTGPTLMTWTGAVATESLAGSTSVMIAPACAASIDTIRAARNRLRIDIPRDLRPAIGQ